VSEDLVSAVSEDSLGRLWVTDSVVGFRELGSRNTYTDIRERGNGTRLLSDRSGNLWIGTSAQGLWRTHTAEKRQHRWVEKATAQLTGLQSDAVTVLFEDREGNIWAGTGEGLSRLTTHKVTPITNLGVVGGVEVARDQSVWVRTDDELFRFKDATMPPFSMSQQFSGTRLRAMHLDDTGVLWMATSRDLLRLSKGHWSPVPLSDGKSVSRVTTITSDRAGGIWLYDLDQGLVRWNRGHLQHFCFTIQCQQYAH
jgi:ligand-binding sensor domain-containing protein